MNSALNRIEKFESYAELLKVLGHPIRLCIINGLLHKGACNVTYMQDCLNIPQSTVSQHISILKNKGIIKGTRKGLEISYTVINPMVEEIIQVLFKDEIPDFTPKTEPKG